MLIHWAVFGERDGGHSLLAASGEHSLAATITQYTDRPGDPPIGLDWDPVHAGFRIANHYVLLRTVQDTDAGRAGMVRSYAAFIPVGDLLLVPRVSDVINRLPQGLARLEEIRPFEIVFSEPKLSETTDLPGLAYVARRLGGGSLPSPLIWGNDGNFLPLVDALWQRLPHSLRLGFAFSFQFAPEHIWPGKSIIVATLPLLASRFNSDQLIRLESNKNDFNSAQSWLVGDPQHQEFPGNLARFGLPMSEFSDLSLLALFEGIVTRLPHVTYTEAVKAIRIIEKFSKSEKVLTVARTSLFQTFCKLIPKVSAEELLTLRNLDGVALSDLVEPLGKEIHKWLEEPRSHEEILRVLQFAFEDNRGWWSEVLIEWLNSVSKLINRFHSRLVWSLAELPYAIRYFEKNLTFSAKGESLLCEAIPTRLETDLGEIFLLLAANRKWMVLHATILLKITSETEAIIRHVEIADGDFSGLDMLLKKTGFSPFLVAACSSGQKMLLAYCGSALKQHHSEVPRTAYTDCPHWFTILNEALQRETINYVNSHLRDIIARTFDVLVGPSESIDILANSVNRYDASIWLVTNRFANILNKLHPTVAEETITIVNTYVVGSLMAKQKVVIEDPSALDPVLKVDVVLSMLKKVALEDAVETGVNAFRCLSLLQDSHCREWLVDLFTRSVSAPLMLEDVSLISSLLLERNFPGAAGVVRDTAELYQREDVTPLFQKIRYKYEMENQQHKNLNKKKRSRLPKVIIATAIPLERKELLKAFGDASYDDKLYADVIEWPPEAPLFQIYVVTTGAGNLEAQSTLLRILARVKPALAFFLGVAGGLKDSEIGDVIYSSKVYYYEGGKEEGGRIMSRPVSERPSEALLQLAHRVADQEWQTSDNFLQLPKPKATQAVIASGEKVLASTDSDADTYRRIKESFNDTQVVDMEAFGFLNALRQKDIKHFMIIRGVSDKLADKASSDQKGNQPIAARNAVSFLLSLLKECPRLVTAKKRRFLGLI